MSVMVTPGGPDFFQIKALPTPQAFDIRNRVRRFMEAALEQEAKAS